MSLTFERQYSRHQAKLIFCFIPIVNPDEHPRAAILLAVIAAQGKIAEESKAARWVRRGQGDS